MIVKDYSVDGGGSREIKVCNHCVCDDCSKTILKPKPKTLKPFVD